MTAGAPRCSGITSMQKLANRHTWKNLEAVELATLDWVDWFNRKRLLGPIGNIPPAEAEAAYYRQQATLPKAA